MLDHFDSLALRRIPGGWETDEAITRPDISSAVFVSVKEDVGEVEVASNEDSVFLARDSQLMLQYNRVCHLLEEDRVSLI